jgi:hypothetical protein
VNDGLLLRQLDRFQDSAVLLGPQAEVKLDLRLPLLNQGDDFPILNVLIEIAPEATRLHAERTQLADKRPEDLGTRLGRRDNS